MAARNRTAPENARGQARQAGIQNRTGCEFAGELGPEGATPESTQRDPQQTHAAGPDLWGAPD